MAPYLEKDMTLLVELAVQRAVAGELLWNDGRRVTWNWRESYKMR